MAKIGMILLLALAGVMYYLKDKKLDTLTKSKKELVKEGSVEAGSEDIFAPKWKYGTCLFESDKSWDHEKILYVSKDEYKFVLCRKFKGCTTESKSYPAKAYEMDRATYVVKPCQ